MTSPWIPVFLSDDLPDGVAAPALAHGRELAVWRSASGRLSAWVDRCPHRGMRLSHGFVRGEMLACIYHGWSYDSTGQCRRIPAHPEVSPPVAIRTTALACAERDGVIWVGDETAAGDPPGLDGLLPVRALEIVAPEDVAIEALAAAGCRALTAARPDARTFVVVLAEAGADARARIAASRAAEAARQRAERGEAA